MIINGIEYDRFFNIDHGCKLFDLRVNEGHHTTRSLVRASTMEDAFWGFIQSPWFFDNYPAHDYYTDGQLERANEIGVLGGCVESHEGGWVWTEMVECDAIA